MSFVVEHRLENLNIKMDFVTENSEISQYSQMEMEIVLNIRNTKTK